MIARRLAAILAADVVGYSRLIGADEAGTLARLRTLRREVVEPLVAENDGRVFKTTGDGLLAEFPSTVQALRCAISVQERLRGGDLQLRVGVHQGDVVVEGDDLLGDGVNVAARLEGLAEPGGICISGRVREDAVGKLSLDVDDLGEPELKNIAQRHRVFRVRLGAPERPALALPDKPSLAVLPFQNMSGDPEQEYFADGMVEEIITGLSRVRSFFVIARNSSFSYKGKSPDVRQVGRELGVRYVLEGSVRKAGNRVRITGQLVEAATGTHLWADRFEGALDDIFQLQDRITASVVGAIEPSIRAAEAKRAQHKPTEHLDAYDLVLRAWPHVRAFTLEGARVGTALLERALALDPDYAQALVQLAFCYYMPWQQGWADSDRKEMSEIARLARIGAARGADDADVLGGAAFLIAWTTGDIDAALDLADRAVSLNPNCAQALLAAGQLRAIAGSPDDGLELLARAERLDPKGIQIGLLYGMALAHFIAGRYETAAENTTRSLRFSPGSAASLRVHAASLGLLGRIDEAREAVRRLLAVAPYWTVSRCRHFAEVDQGNLYRRTGFVDAVTEGLRLAGLPE
jgi:adenylate cyclase